MEISKELKEAIVEAMLKDRERYGGSGTAYAKTLNIHGTVFSRLKKGEREHLLSPSQWLNIGRKLQVKLGENTWKAVETDVYLELQDDFRFCQENAKSLILVDDCGIGKTYCAKILVSKMKNAFYVDASQYKSKRLFIKALARELGSGTTGTYSEILENLKYYINALGKVFICIDEAGDLDYAAFLELKGLVNGTTGRCGWYMIGADGLRAKIKRGINNEKVGYREIFDRFSAEFRGITPDDKVQKMDFYDKLLRDVAVANLQDKSNVNAIVKQCFTKKDDKVKSLRYLETLIRTKQVA
ncbi:ATP-binding protein [Riemerella anatipestifer]|uniref:ATP-binding protein n=1 Tax=Riemerella anatipestifer TaxID=34085 RepID=UPI0007ED7EA2|nr:ATP-binding protein [Riemerella anatipestifer]MBT0527098.1 ATP-binding protein [Riemerella anatipestifer]MDR7817111.1 ATP-binding protein [Riemerella anatipestifer]MDR7849656.1 ATP-binding protein [Riemerella anatipestifer]MDR7880326.1 ATP-binding protein [Riemerella anatipestifer]MDY3528695.1 ATP-binding protein [Riemerella anatipestifer]